MSKCCAHPQPSLLDIYPKKMVAALLTSCRDYGVTSLQMVVELYGGWWEAAVTEVLNSWGQ